LSSLNIDTPAGPVSARVYTARADGLDAVYVLAHGAGAGHAHPFLVGMAHGLAARGLPVVTFNFAYKEWGRRVPDQAPVLEQTYLAVIDAVRGWPETRDRALVIGGKSMGGRIASHLAANQAAATGPLAGLVFLGYPLHPPGRPEQRRDTHLPAITAPMLFVQGSRDTFGTPDEFAPVLARLQVAHELFVVEGGDHSFAVPKGAGLRQDEVMAGVQKKIVEWVGDRIA
jgi:hypothetical protein